MSDAEPVPSLSVLIVNYNTKDHLARCLTSLRTFPPEVSHEIIVIDNRSADGSPQAVQQYFSECILIQAGSNEGYGVALNRAAQCARGRWLLFLNPDIEVTERAISILLEFARRHPTAGVVGPRLLYPDRRPQPSVHRFPSSGLLLLESSRLHLLLPQKLRAQLLLGPYFLCDVTRDVPWICGACHLIPRDVWDVVGFLSEDTFCGQDDYDYCYRTRKRGYEVWLCAEATMIHHCSAAVRERWPQYAIDELCIHNTYVLLGAHWPFWRVRLYSIAECVCWLLELLRVSLASRPGIDAASHATRVTKMLRLVWAILIGRQAPIRRFEPSQKIR
jgi:GT2 family glycosyltransferase